MSDILLIGSCEPFSGKSAMVLGIAKKLLQEKNKVRIGKPLATCIELTNLPSMSYEGLIDDDVKFIGSTLNIEEENLISSVGLLDNISAEKRIFNKDLLPGKGFDQIEGLIDDDVKFIGSTLNVEEENLIHSVGLFDNISAEKRIFNKDLIP